MGCDSSGMDYPQGTRLERTESIHNGEVTWEEVYHYNAEGQLVMIEDNDEAGHRHVIEYEDGRVLQILRYQKDINKLIRKDSLVYNVDGQIGSKYFIFYPMRAGLPIAKDRTDFEYGSTGQIRRIIDRPSSPDEGEIISEFSWNGSTLDRSKFYVRGNLWSESTYRFDYHANYRKGDPRYLANPVLGGDHNVIRISFRDNHFAIDRACNPCEWNYTYNRRGLPVRLNSGSGYEVRYWYSEVDSEKKCCFGR